MPGIIYTDRQGPPTPKHCLHHLTPLFRNRHICDDGERLRILRRELRCDGFGCLPKPVNDGHPCARVGQRVAERAPDALAPPVTSATFPSNMNLSRIGFDSLTASFKNILLSTARSPALPAPFGARHRISGSSGRIGRGTR